jgi:hypothetical protein
VLLVIGAAIALGARRQRAALTTMIERLEALSSTSVRPAFTSRMH